MIHNPKILKELNATDVQAAWKSAVFFKTFLKESDCENTSNNFCGIFFCIYIHILKRQLSATKRWQIHRFVETYQNTTMLPIKSNF